MCQQTLVVLVNEPDVVPGLKGRYVILCQVQ